MKIEFKKRDAEDKDEHWMAHIPNDKVPVHINHASGTGPTVPKAYEDLLDSLRFYSNIEVAPLEVVKFSTQALAEIEGKEKEV